MNHDELIQRISERTGVDTGSCDKVIRAFEDVLNEGLSEKEWKSRMFDRVVQMMNSVKAKKDARDIPNNTPGNE